MEPAHRLGRIQGHHAGHGLSSPAPVVGVFDSGIGGLSVLRALQQALPGARFDYLADKAWAPYGEKPAAELRERIESLVSRWRRSSGLDLLVLACNSATAVAIDHLRHAHPGLPIVGIEPAIRPALRRTASGQVGVLATRATLHSPRYQALRNACLAEAPGARLHEHAADGLADAIEHGDAAAIQALCQIHLRALLALAPAMDTLVLGCTHYPLAEAAWRKVQPGLRLVDPAHAVAARAGQLLAASGAGNAAIHPVTWRCTGEPASLARAASQWLGLRAQVQPASLGA